MEPTEDGWYRWHGEDLELSIRVQPGAPRDAIGAVSAGVLRVRIKAAPVDGKANLALCRFLAAVFDVSPSRVEIFRGARGRAKRILIRGPGRLPAFIAGADHGPSSRSSGHP